MNTGCSPVISADTPAGLTADVKVPQEGLLNREGLSMSDIENTQVTLPEGVVINPGQAAGLGACSEAQSAVGTEGEASCPSSSKVGTDSIETPLLATLLFGLNPWALYFGRRAWLEGQPGLTLLALWAGG